MYISNNSVGMATLLQQNKNCMKTLTNGGSNIIVGNVVSTQAPTAQLAVNSTLGATTATTITPTTNATLGGNIVLQPQPTIVLTNGATSSVISYQQYQQLLAQQQHIQQQQIVSLPLGSFVTTGNGNLTVLAGNNNANNTQTQGAFLVAATAAPNAATTNQISTSNVNTFQQQFQQQIQQQQQQQTNTLNTTSLNNLLQQQQQLQQVATTRATGAIFTQPNITSTSTTAANAVGVTRHFSQFSQQTQQQQQPANSTNNRTTHVLINRNNNTIIAGNTTQRLQHAKILNKPATQRVINTTTLQPIKQQQLQLKQQQQQQPQTQQLQQKTTILKSNNTIQIAPTAVGTVTKLITAAAAPTAPAATAATAVATQPAFSGTATLMPSTTASYMNAVPATINPTAALSNGNINQNNLINSTATATATFSQQNAMTATNDVPAITANATATDTAAVNPTVDELETGDTEPEIDIVINNVVCSFSVRCHLNLREIALRGFNVEYRRENGMVTMKLRHPYTTASIWSSGRITCTGATSEAQAKIAARRYARCLEKLGFRVRFQNFRVVNVLGTCSMPWAIKIVNFSEKHKKDANYEPELHPGVTYKLFYPKATLKIFSTGSITVTAASVAHVQAAIEHIYPLVHEFRKKRSPEEQEQLRLKQMNQRLHDMPDMEDVSGNLDVNGMKTAVKRGPSIIEINPMNKKFAASPFGIDDAEIDGDDPEPNEYVMFDNPDDLIEGPDDDDDDEVDDDL